MTERKKNPTFPYLMALLALMCIISLASCDMPESSVTVKVPRSLVRENMELRMSGPREMSSPVTRERLYFMASPGTYAWELVDTTWTTGPVAEGNIVIGPGRNGLIIPEQTLSRVTLRIESDVPFMTELTTLTSERGLSERRRLYLMPGVANEMVYEDMPEGTFSIQMTDEGGNSMPPLTFTVETGKENLFRVDYRREEGGERSRDVTLAVMSSVSMDTEIFWRKKGSDEFNTLPIRLMSDSIVRTTVRSVPLGDVDFAVGKGDGTLGPVKTFTVTEDGSSCFYLDAGLSAEEPGVKVTVRLTSDENRNAILCFTAPGMSVPKKHQVTLSTFEKIFILDHQSEGMLTLWLETDEGKEEARTDIFVQKGHVNTVELVHRKPQSGTERPVMPDEKKPVPLPDPEPKWGKLNLHIKANSTEPCILYFLYPGDKEWRTHETRFNGAVVGRDYEFNNIPPGKFRYTFGLPGEKPFPVQSVDIKKGMNSAYYVYWIDPPEVPELPDPVPPSPEVGNDPLPPPVPGPDEPDPKPDPPAKVLKGHIEIEEFQGRDMKILRFVNDSTCTDITCTWYVDGKRWGTGQTLRIRSGQGSLAEVWVNSPSAEEEIMISCMIHTGSTFVPFRTGKASYAL